MLIKKFCNWIQIKQKLDATDYNPPFIRVGDLWWCSIGENVGVEVNGKGRNFTCPIIILKKFERQAFFGIPTTTKYRDGNWYVLFSFKGITEYAMLTQARMFSYKRLGQKIGSVDEKSLETIKEAFSRLFY